MPFAAFAAAAALALSIATPSPPAASALLERSLLAARACSLAFVPPAAMAREPYGTQLRCIAQVEEPASLCGATVFESSVDGSLVVACRGSASALNFRTNLAIGPVPLTIGGSSAEASKARVHEVSLP